MALNLSGLASGIDTSSIVEQLMAIERQPRTRLQWSQQAVQARQSTLRDIDTRLTNLLNAARALRDSSLWAGNQTVDSSDGTKVTGRFVSAVGPGPYTVDITQLASAEQRTYSYSAKNGATTITINGVAIAIDANATVQRVVDQINVASNSPVYASVSGANLVLVNKTTGAANTISASGQGNQLQQTSVVAGKDAAYKVNGTSYTSSSNVTTTGLPGVELSLWGIGSATITVSASGINKQVVKDKVKAFVDQYNSTVDFIRSKLDEKKVANPATEADAIKGVLYADSTLNSLLRQLRQGVADVVSNGNPTTLDQLSEIGITTGAITGSGTVSSDAVAGRLVIDDAKLSAALDSSSTQVRQLLGAVSGIDGFAQRIEGLIDPETRGGGLIDGRLSSADSELKRIRDDLAAMDERLAQKEARLKAQFAAMEKVLSASQAQGSWLSGQIAQLPTATKG